MLLLSVGLIPENELSKEAGIPLDSRTNGPIVYENMETLVPGIFACGNVLHVHDLADNASIEASRAGYYAKKYIDNLQKNNNIPFIPKKRGINVLTYFNRPARPSELPINHLSLPTNADAN